MKNDPTKHPVRVSYANSDKVRTVHVPRQAPEVSATAQTPPSEESPDTTKASPASFVTTAKGQLHTPEATVDTSATPDIGSVSESPKTDSPQTEANPAKVGEKSASASKPKADIETVEQFIEYAYGRKGQRVSLKPKVEKAIAQNPKLEDGALTRLLSLAASDPLLAVPRQLLLVSRDIDGYPGLRATLGSFVSTVMQRHPAFADTGVLAALRNLPEALLPAEALAKVAAFSPADDGDKEPLKGADLLALRRNATHLFAAWLASNRGMNAEELAALLFQVMWAPAALDLVDDNARLRALTEIEQQAGVGLACQRFRQQAIDARSSQDQALREANELRRQLAETDANRLQAEEKRDALEAELQALRESAANEAAELRRQHEVERTHLRHVHEQLRGRLVRRLGEGADELIVGLSALRNKRDDVMTQRAELVVDALRTEISNLRED